MKPLKSLAGIILAFLSCYVSSAQDILDFEMTVRLQQNGDALVEQVWTCDVYQGTEWYVPIGSTKGFGMSLTDLQVSENGRAFVSEGRSWDVDRSREKKAGRCGIVDKSDGSMELCWGVGSDGEHVWNVSYTLKGLVQSFDECDGWGFQFLGDEYQGPAKHAKVTVRCDFETPEWDGGVNVGAWSFGFRSKVDFYGNSAVIESTEPFGSKSRIALMMRFDKGMFSPEVEGPMSWEKFQKKAFKGSDYKNVSKGIGKAVGWMFEDIEGLGGLVLAILTVGIICIGSFLRRKYIQLTGKRYKPAVFGTAKIDGWWRDAPLGGNLCAAYSLLKNGDRLAEDYDKNLIGAYYLKWIQDGLLTVVKEPTQKSERAILRFKEGAGPVFTDPAEIDLYNMAAQAAGNNLLLEQDEFKAWSKAHYSQVMSWPSKADSSGKIVWQQASVQERQRVVQLRNYLKDFTLMNERDAEHVKLWKFYMVYAQMLGIADKVAKNFERLYPEEFREYTSGFGMGPGMSYYVLLNTSNRYTHSFYNTAKAKADAVAAAERRSSGGGGSGSFGGGHSFGGGGSHGGGTR